MRNLWFEKEINEMLKVVASVNNETELRKIFDVILTPREINDMARRLKIISLLNEGKNYMEIRERLKISPTIISRVSGRIGYGFRSSEKRADSDNGSSKTPKRKIRYKGSPTIIDLIT